MAIEDYFGDIIVLKLVGKKTDQVGGRVENWGKAATIQGVINARYANQSTVSGKSGEMSEYNGLFEITDDSTTYLKPENRLQDANGKIYRINGEIKNTINMNHHYKVDLEYVTHING
jgi:hypothetical protein